MALHKDLIEEGKKSTLDLAAKKPISVVLILSQFDELNGHYNNGLDSEINHDDYIKDYFTKRYGPGTGRLEIQLKQSKAKIMWFLPEYDPDAEKCHQNALSKAKTKNYKEAINSWVKAISINANDPDFYFNLGIAFFEIKNYKESVENLKVALNLCPIYYKAHLILGTVNLKVRQFDDAERHLRESLLFVPNHALAYLNLGAVYSILKRYDEGIRMFEKTIELSSREVRAHFGLGKIYSLKGNTERANEYFKNVIEYDTSGRLTTHAQRAMVAAPLSIDGLSEATIIDTSDAEDLYQNGYKAFLYTDYDRSIQMYESYLKKKPNDDFVTFSLGEAFLRSGQVLKAVAAYQKAVSINPSKALYHKALAVAFNTLDKTSDVIKHAKKAQQLGKNDSIVQALLGKGMMALNKVPEAVEILENAVKLSPNNLYAKFQLALALLKAKDTDSATNHLQEIIRSPIQSPIKMDAESLLASGPSFTN